MNRKTATRQKVDEAIKRLVGTNESINFNSVANESGVSKATLYNNVPIRESRGEMFPEYYKGIHGQEYRLQDFQ